MDDHADDAGTAGAAAQVDARVLDFVLQELVQLPAQLLHQLSHLGNTFRASLIQAFNYGHFLPYPLTLCFLVSFTPQHK